MTSPTETASRSPASKSPPIAAALSAVIPGMGHIYAGSIRRGLKFLFANVVMLAVLLFFFHDKLTIAKAFVRPSSLTIMMIVSFAFLGYRAWAASDAYQEAKKGSHSGPSTSSSALLSFVVVAGMLIVPHAVFSYYDLIQYNLITTVFASPSPADLSAAQPASTVATDTGGESLAVPGDASPAPTTTVAQATEKIWNGRDRLNILLIGGDLGIGRTTIRTDSMITVSIDPQSGETAMFQIPRNWTYAPLPEGMGVWDCDCYPGLTNELWVMGERFPDAFPGPLSPSENAVIGMTSAFLGIPIHYYALVNLDGFVDLVDALGGVDIYVERGLVDNEFPDYTDGSITTLVIEQGQQHMNGELALAYSRTRHQDSDYARMFRQRCVLEGLLDQTDPVSLLLNFGALSKVIQDTMITSIPIDALPDLVDLMALVEKDEIVSIRFIPPKYHLKFRDDGLPGRIANIDLVQEHVQLILNDPQRAKVELGLEESEECPTDPNL